MKAHVYSVKFHALTYWDTRNTEVAVNCTSVKQARRIVAACGYAGYPLTII